MSNNERFSQIIAYLKTHRSASVEELAELLYVSAATVRRDLNELQKRGQVERSHGGAILMEGADEISIFIRQVKNAREKEEAASVALKHMPDFQTVFIDNSSTCLALAERMNLAHKTVVTNGLQIAMRISRHDDVNLIMPGGEVHFNTNAVSGSLTCNLLHSFRIDLMLCSCAAIDENGTYEHSLETILLKQTAIAQSKTRVLLVDRNKFSTTAAYCTGTLSAYDAIVTDAEDELIAPYRAMNLNVINR